MRSIYRASANNLVLLISTNGKKKKASAFAEAFSFVSDYKLGALALPAR